MQNFGKIKNTFNTLLVEGIADKSNRNKNIFRQFVKALKESKILKTQFNVYDIIEHCCESDDFKSSEFVKEAISLLNSFKKEDIEKENKKLVGILEKYNLSVSDLPYDRTDLHDNISKLIFTKKTSKNINQIVESLEKVISHVKSNVNETTDNDFLPNSMIGGLLVDKFNTKYQGLNEGERKALKAIIDADEEGKKEIFKNTVSECLVLLNGRLKESTDVDEKETLLNVKETLLQIEYTEANFISEISRIINLKKAFND